MSGYSTSFLIFCIAARGTKTTPYFLMPLGQISVAGLDATRTQALVATLTAASTA